VNDAPFASALSPPDHSTPLKKGPSKPLRSDARLQRIDQQQDYFADGMVEEIIIGLSRFRWLFVIARNSSFTDKGRAVDVKRRII
jgi:hypothetical protein